MPVQKFGVYDIVVDIIPAVLFTILLLPAAFSFEHISALESMLNSPVAILLVLPIIYVIGRLIHGAAAILSRKKKDTLGVKPDSEIIFTSSIDPISVQILDNLGDEMEDHLNIDVDLRNVDYSEYRTIRQLAYSELYPDETLYRRYEIITTFLRSVLFTITFSFSIYIILFIFIGASRLSSTTYGFWSTEYSSFIYTADLRVILFTIMAKALIYLGVRYLLIEQYWKFWERREDSLFNDFYLRLIDK